MNEIKSKLVALEAKVDAKLFAVSGYTGSVRGQRRSIIRGEDGKWYREDGTEANTVGDFKTFKGAALTAGAVGSGLVADRALMNRYGGGGSGMAVRGSAYRSAGRDLMESGRFMGGRVLDKANEGIAAGQRSWRATKPGAFGRVAMRADGSTSMFTKPTKPGGLLYRLRKAIGTGLGVATGGKLKFSQEIKERIVELAMVQKADARKLNDYKALHLSNQNAKKAVKAGKMGKKPKITPEFQRAVFRAVFGKGKF